MFYEGRQIGGYTLLRKLGRGGFGEVWLAEKRSQFVTKKVAVKLPLDEQVNLDAIRQEAELWEQASGHPNVLPIIDADIIDSQVVIVSEYASGGSLADRLKHDGQLPLQKAVEMTIGILNGLEFLHSRKIIHRDIKPQNILLQGDTPRLADFGISRAMNTTVVSSAIIGTDAYMSPESFDGKRTVQTDIWSVGVVLYALLADRLPFPQEHPSERMFAILTKELEPLPADVPQNLQRIVYKALAKQPENRYQTTTEMRDELQKALVGIAHPTFAPTEVFRIRAENLPTIPTLEEIDETNEPEKEPVAAPQNFNIPAPTESSLPNDSVMTHFKQTPPTNEPAFSATLPAVQFQQSGRQSGNPQKSFGSASSVAGKPMNLVFVIGGMVGIFFLVASVLVIVRIINPSVSPNLSNNSNSSVVSLTNSASNMVSNTASNTASVAEMKIELETTGKKTPVLATVDGKIGLLYLEPGEVKRISPQEKIYLTLSLEEISNFKFRINGKTIALPTTATYKNTVQFEINRNNLDQILQSGKITEVVSLPQ
jgi:serine/threonine protein kinase